jgi:hypothetical protein
LRSHFFITSATPRASHRIGNAAPGRRAAREADKGLFFHGAGALPFGERIAPVRARIERLLTPGVALGAA